MIGPIPDVVVVGAGGSGAPLAARLAERGLHVVLLESGPVPAPESTRDGSSLAAAVPGHPLAFTYPGALTATRDHTVVRGRVAGGSTAINGGYFRRPRASDLDAWARAAGDPRWTETATLPLWSRIETDREFGLAPGHGRHGPLPVTRGDSSHPVSAALIAAGLAAGLPFDPDQNASPEVAPGIGQTPTNTLGGERWSTALAYLDPAPGGLEVRGGHHAQAVVIGAHGRATGVEVLVDGRIETLTAGLIVWCSGALETPQLLVRSGIGPAGVLTAAGRAVVLDAPVGAELHDHPQVVMPFEVPPSVLTHPVDASLGVSAHGSSDIEGGTGDLEVLSVLRPLGRMLGTEPDDARLSLLVSTLRTSTPGRLLFDASGPPLLGFHYLDSESDRERLRLAVRLAASLLESDAMQHLGVRPEHRGLAQLDDDALNSWMLDHLSTALHTCGTTPMGTDPATSVVDGKGAVHGVAGLHIADLGILPTAPTSGPAATAVLIGEVIADALTR